MRFLSDYLLLQILTGFEISTGGYGSRNVRRSSERAMDEFLTTVESRGIKKNQASRSFQSLRSSGYLRYPVGQGSPQITEVGLRRLKSILSIYDERRVWDGKLYVVTYDIPERRRRERGILREALVKIGCGKMQDSVWITPYDPRGVLKDLVFTHKIAGYVVVSEVGSQGMLGGESFQTLVGKIYRLDNLSRDYAQFTEKYQDDWLSPYLPWDFLAILRNDPQLPFPLLPKDWPGKRAYEIYRKSKLGKSLLTL